MVLRLAAKKCDAHAPEVRFAVMGLGMQELLVIMVIVLLLFGGSRLPGIASGLGGAVHSFKKALRGGEEEARSDGGTSTADKVPTPQDQANKQA